MLDPQAGLDEQAAEAELPRDEACQRIDVAVIVFTDTGIHAGTGRARKGRVAVPLPAALVFGVKADARVEAGRNGSERDVGRKAGLDAQHIIVPQAPLVAAGGGEVGHARAGRIR